MVEELQEEMPDFSGASGLVVLHTDDGSAFTDDQRAEYDDAGEQTETAGNPPEMLAQFDPQQQMLGVLTGRRRPSGCVRDPLLLMPALMHPLGKSAWWLPNWLDRNLPYAGVEGAALERTHPTSTTEREKGIDVSLTASVLNALAGLLAPKRDTPEAFGRGIEANRRKGAAAPPKRALKDVTFTDQQECGDRVFRLRPATADPRLRFVYLHGGAYVNEVQSVQWSLTTGLISRVPATVIAPMYPLAPEHTWREGVAAVERAYLSAVGEVGASKVVVYGDSAGGGLALALAQRLRDNGVSLPAALVLFSPWLDLSVTGPDQPDIEQRDPVLTIAFLRQAGQLWAGDTPVDDPRVSPLFGDHTGLPPTIVFSGTRDILDSDALRLANANPEIVHRHYPGMMHVWPAARMPEGRRALNEAAAFVRQHT